MGVGQLGLHRIEAVPQPIGAAAFGFNRLLRPLPDLLGPVCPDLSAIGTIPLNARSLFRLIDTAEFRLRPRVRLIELLPECRDSHFQGSNHAPFLGKFALQHTHKAREFREFIPETFPE